MDKVPWLFARIREPGVARRCLDQWSEVREELHHQFTRKVMTSPLRQAIEAVNEDGSGVSLELWSAFEGLSLAPSDDSVAGGPHARATRLCGHSRRATWAWVASSLRIKQNLQDVRDFSQSLEFDLDQLWCGSTSVVRLGGRHPYQRPRMSHQRFLNHLYCMSFVHDPVADNVDDEASGSEGNDEDDDGQDDNDDRPGAAGSSTDGKPSGSAGGKPSGSGAPSGGGGGGGSGDAPKEAKGSECRKKESQETKLLRSYLHACLSLHNIISIPVDGEEGAIEHMFFQVLTLNTKAIVVDTYATAAQAEQEKGLYSCGVQPLTVWKSTSAPGSQAGAVPLEADLYHFRDPCTVDLLGLTGSKQERRHLWTKWQTKASGVDGCVCAHSLVVLSPQMSLASAKILVLCLMDALKIGGWGQLQRRVDHSPHHASFYDARSLASKRAYLQAVLSCDELYRAGVETFVSGHAAS